MVPATRHEDVGAWAIPPHILLEYMGARRPRGPGFCSYILMSAAKALAGLMRSEWVTTDDLATLLWWCAMRSEWGDS